MAFRLLPGIMLALLESTRAVGAIDCLRVPAPDSLPVGAMDGLPLSSIDVCLFAPPRAAVSH